MTSALESDPDYELKQVLLGHGRARCPAAAGDLTDSEVEIGELDFQRTHYLARGHIVRLDP